MRDCIFCKIAKGEIPAHFIWQDKEFLAILDKFPLAKGQILVIPKKHYPSDIFKMPESAYKKILSAAKKTARILKKKLKVERVIMVVEGLDVNHAHIKLYPFSCETKGYAPLSIGKEASDKSLKELVRKLKS